MALRLCNKANMRVHESEQLYWSFSAETQNSKSSDTDSVKFSLVCRNTPTFRKAMSMKVYYLDLSFDGIRDTHQFLEACNLIRGAIANL